jgi:hypothetical protein
VVAAGDGGEADEAADLDVVGAHAVGGAAELATTLDVQQVRADALDLRAHRAQQLAQLLHVRLTRGVDDRGAAVRERGGHQRVLGTGDRGLVEEQLGAPQTARCPELVRAVDLDHRAETRQREEVRVDAPAADHVAARRRHLGPAEAAEQRAGQQDRRADLLGQPLVEGAGRDVGGADTDLVRPGPGDLGPQVVEQLEHRLDVADARHVRELDGLGGQQRGR